MWYNLGRIIIMEKEKIKKQLIESMSKLSSIRKLILFGSFITEKQPHDIDLAVIDDRDNDYITLSLSYRKALRDISRIIPIDVFPIRSGQNNRDSMMLSEIENGEVIYERRR